ncbi:MAG: SIMPL domain-containing protein [Endomicrobium sp.]|jgi:uncharacterized protein YggE|nr:SIMPL domain-containing protein [Endomicrobium sp.]
MKKVFAVLAVLFIFSGAVFAGENDQYFTVEADAIVLVKPDKVVLGLGVFTKGKNLLETRKKNSAIVKKSIEYCKQCGISEKDIQTGYLNVRPEYRTYESSETNFTIEQRLTVVLEDISKYDEILTELLSFGVNRVNDVNFQINDVKKYRNEARKLAITAAKAKAEFLSKEAGFKLENIISMSDFTNEFYPRGGLLHSNVISQTIQADAGSIGGNFYDTFAPGMIPIIAKVALIYKVANK